MESEIERLRKKVENFPSPSSYARLAELLHLARQDAEAEAICRKCIKEFPRQAQPFVILAQIQLASGHADAAGDSLRQALERDPRHYAAVRLYADWLAQRQDYPAAVAQLRRLLAQRPDDAALKQRLAELEARLPGGAPAAPPPAAAPASSSGPTEPGTSAISRAIPGVRRSAFEALAAEAGVQVAAIADARGEVVLARNRTARAGAEDLLAAHAAAVAVALAEVARCLGQPAPSSWVLAAECGQVLAFRRRDQQLVALTDASVRPALIELRARQALVDLGSP